MSEDAFPILKGLTSHKLSAADNAVSKLDRRRNDITGSREEFCDIGRYIHTLLGQRDRRIFFLVFVLIDHFLQLIVLFHRLCFFCHVIKMLSAVFF